MALKFFVMFITVALIVLVIGSFVNQKGKLYENASFLGGFCVIAAIISGFFVVGGF